MANGRNPTTRVFGGILEGNSLLPTLPFLGQAIAGPPGPRPGILNPDAAREARQRAILDAGLSLLANTGPSLTPQNPLAAIGRAGQVFVQARDREEARGLAQQEAEAEAARRAAAREALLSGDFTDRQRTFLSGLFDIDPRAAAGMAVEQTARNEAEAREAELSRVTDAALTRLGADASTRELVGFLPASERIAFVQRAQQAESAADAEAALRVQQDETFRRLGMDPDAYVSFSTSDRSEALLERMAPPEVQLFNTDGGIVAADKTTGDIVNVQRVPGMGGDPLAELGDRADAIRRELEPRQAVRRYGLGRTAWDRARRAFQAEVGDRTADGVLITAAVQSADPDSIVTGGESGNIQERVQSMPGPLLEYYNLISSGVELSGPQRAELMQTIERNVMALESAYLQDVGGFIAEAEQRGFTDPLYQRAGLVRSSPEWLFPELQSVTFDNVPGPNMPIVVPPADHVPSWGVGPGLDPFGRPVIRPPLLPGR